MWWGENIFPLRSSFSLLGGLRRSASCPTWETRGLLSAPRGDKVALALVNWERKSSQWSGRERSSANDGRGLVLRMRWVEVARPRPQDVSKGPQATWRSWRPRAELRAQLGPLPCPLRVFLQPPESPRWVECILRRHVFLRCLCFWRWGNCLLGVLYWAESIIALLPFSWRFSITLFTQNLLKLL